MEQERSLTSVLLSDIVDQYMLMTFIDKKTYYANFLFHGKVVWKELFNKSFFATKNVRVKVFHDANGYYILKPKDLLRVLGVSVQDECGLTPLLQSGAVTTEIIQIPTTACKTCSSDLCTIVSSNVIFNEEEFGGKVYNLRTTFKVLSSGELKEYQEYPVYDEHSGAVNIEVREVTACTLDLNPCGCPKETTTNLTNLRNCGCDCSGFLLHCNRCDKPSMRNKAGYFNHAIDSSRIYIRAEGYRSLPATLILSYQHNGMGSETEILVPEYADMAMFAGIKYYTSLYRENRGSNRELKDHWQEQRAELRRFIYPLDMASLKKTEAIIPKWG